MEEVREIFYSEGCIVYHIMVQTEKASIWVGREGTGVPRLLQSPGNQYLQNTHNTQVRKLSIDCGEDSTPQGHIPRRVHLPTVLGEELGYGKGRKQNSVTHSAIKLHDLHHVIKII